MITLLRIEQWLLILRIQNGDNGENLDLAFQGAECSSTCVTSLYFVDPILEGMCPAVGNSQRLEYRV
jgi:hypothetical protein